MAWSCFSFHVAYCSGVPGVWILKCNCQSRQSSRAHPVGIHASLELRKRQGGEHLPSGKVILLLLMFSSSSDAVCAQDPCNAAVSIVVHYMVIKDRSKCQPGKEMLPFVKVWPPHSWMKLKETYAEPGSMLIYSLCALPVGHKNIAGMRQKRLPNCSAKI